MSALGQKRTHAAQQSDRYFTTASALGGIVKPSATNSNFSGCSTVRSKTWPLENLIQGDRGAPKRKYILRIVEIIEPPPQYSGA
jgi:hypothetical protein